jgi:hypothetical protein
MVTRLVLSWLCLAMFAEVVQADSHRRIAASSLVGARDGSRATVYRGTWSSSSTGHTGPMRARVTPRADGNYDARFTGRFLLVIPFTYRVQLSTVGCSPSGPVLSAHKQLGPLLGSYDMTTHLSPRSMTGSFQAAGDSGSIQLRRVR